jgi:hypothetical protein
MNARNYEEKNMPSTEANQQATKRMRGDGSIYRRGSTFWICVYVDGKQQRESAKTGDETTALKYLRNRLKEVHAHELDPAKPFLTQRAHRRTVSDLMDALKADLEIRSKWNPQTKTTSDHVTRASASTCLWCGLLRVTWRRIQAAHRHAESTSAHIPCRWNTGPFFLENARRWMDALRRAGADVVMNERSGSHGGAFWRDEFPLMVAWAFGRRCISVA